MRQYELALIFNSSLTPDQRKKLLDTIKSWVKDLKITKEDELGQKALAYPINHEKIGFYQVLSLEGETIPAEFEKRVLNNDQVLRHLLIRTK